MSIPSAEKTYIPKEKGHSSNDGREAELVAFVMSKEGLRGNPKGIIEAIDEFVCTRKWLMNIGAGKGKTVCDLITAAKPNTMVELGGYCGYSAILFASTQRAAGGKKYYSLESNANFAANISTLVELAGLSDFVEVVVGPANESIQSLHDAGKLDRIDMLFIDHHKPAYTPDLKLCESLGLIKEGTILAADNVIVPGNPQYLKYVFSSVDEKTKALEEGEEEKEALDSYHKGNPRLIYNTELVHNYALSGMHDAVAVSQCMGEV